MNRNLFRKNAMLKAASPFELNRLVSIFNGREALALLALGNLSFWLCDRALTAITPLYRQRIAPRLKKKF